MLSSFWAGLGGEFAKQWAARVLSPAFAFWAGGLAAVWWRLRRDGVRRYGWRVEIRADAHHLARLPGVVLAAAVVAGLVVLAASAFAAERFTLPVLRLLCGQWPFPLPLLPARYRAVRRRRRAAVVQRLRAARVRGRLTAPEYDLLRRMTAVPPAVPPDPVTLAALRARSSPRPGQLYRLTRLEAALRRCPAVPTATRLGDTLAAAEQLPQVKYGLVAADCWVPLWLLLPEETKREVARARLALDDAVRVWLWGALFLCWSWCTWWALPAGLAAMAVSYAVGALGAGRTFGTAVVAVFDLHRFQLYTALHLPLPTSPADEPAQGALVTRLLRSGAPLASPAYAHPPP